MAAVSAAASLFGAALESCARCMKDLEFEGKEATMLIPPVSFDQARVLATQQKGL